MNGRAGRQTRNQWSWSRATLCFFLFGAAVLLPSLHAQAARPAASTYKLRTLTTVLEAHSLPASEATRGYPIHLKAVVTFYDPYVDPRQTAVFVHDATGSMFLGLRNGVQWPISVGSLVDVKGVSGMGDFAPVIASPRVTVIGRAPLPATAPQVSLARLLTGQEDGQWVEVEGVVHSVFETSHDIVLQVAMADGTIAATLPREPSLAYTSLTDAKVRIHAHAVPLFNGEGQMFGARLLVPNMASIQIVEPGPGDALALPVRSISSLSRYDPVSPLPRRVHVRGRVTLAWPASLLCIRDATRGLCARSTQGSPPALGEMVDVAGFTESGGSAPSLDNAIFRSASVLPARSGMAALEPVPATPVTAKEALNGKHDSELVQMDGLLIGRDLAASDTTLMLASKGFVYAVLLPRSLGDKVSASWKNGSRLHVVGICSVQFDVQRSEREGGAPARKSFRVLLRSSSDVVVLQKPSWWTPEHTVPVLTVGLLVTLLVLAWVVVLTRHLKQQTGVIRESEEQYRHMAQHDALTGLPMRLLLRDRLDAALERAKRYGTGVALLMLDLDNFKLINDSLGHQAGDQALKIAALRIGQAVRSSDTVARISGDEFVVLISELNEPHEAELVAAKIVAGLSASFRFGDREVPLSASVGVCTGSTSGLDADALLKCVDAAMYHAKAKGRNCFQLYTADMARFAEENLRLRAGLQRALSADELEVHYQPMVNFQTGELTGFEALLRWRSKEMGMIMPSDFIPVAEQTGLIIPIGEWVLRESCRDIGLLERQIGRSLMLSVNLSPRQIEQQDLPEAIERALRESGRSPHEVEFEITESMLMSDSSISDPVLTQLRELGVRLAIDDFGVGFSSLSYITRFSIDRIKIDRSFIKKCMKESGNLAVVRAMVAMAHGLSMTVVAEGVETAAEFRFLREEGCDTAQGYYLSRPVPAHELSATVVGLDVLASNQHDGAIVEG